jgi:hypothetical protein
MIEELYNLFVSLCATLEVDDLYGKLYLENDGNGEFLLVERRLGALKYPHWAKKQQLQASWLTNEEGLAKLKEIAQRAFA